LRPGGADWPEKFAAAARRKCQAGNLHHHAQKRASNLPRRIKICVGLNGIMKKRNRVLANNINAQRGNSFSLGRGEHSTTLRTIRGHSPVRRKPQQSVERPRRLWYNEDTLSMTTTHTLRKPVESSTHYSSERKRWRWAFSWRSGSPGARDAAVGVVVAEITHR